MEDMVICKGANCPTEEDYDIPTGVVGGGGKLAGILTANSDKLGSIIKGALDSQAEVLTAQVLATQASSHSQEVIAGETVKHFDKKNEHLDFAKDGKSGLKNTSGEEIKPRDEEAKLNSEKRIDEERANGISIGGILEKLDEDNDLDSNIMSDILNSFVDGIDVAELDKIGG
jgi:hypothetical protein